MPAERIPGSASVIDVIDRVLDKGIVVESWLRVRLVAIDLHGNESRVVVDSLETDLEHSNGADAAAASKPAQGRRAAEPVADHTIPRALKKRRGNDEGSTGSGSGAHAGTADLLPRSLPGQDRRPID